MKKNIIYKGMAALLAVGAFASCADSYLDVEPVTNVSQAEAMSTVDGCRMAMNGIYLAMNSQYQSLDFNGNSGEAYIGTFCDDMYGADVVFGLWGYYTSMYNWGSMSNERAYVNLIPWSYYYGLIDKANKILNGITIDKDTNDEDVLALHYIMAEALTMRAHSYQKLLGLYGPRYEDSRNGEQLCLVMRLNNDEINVPLCSFKTVVDQIYKDLDQALEWYAAGGGSRSAKSEVDASVAHGIYARTALINHDWEYAYTHAAEARKGYTVMDEATYKAGFYVDNSDFIWSCDPGFDTTYYWSWGSHYACNGGYLNAWEFGAGAINIDLYNATDPNDIRRDLYLMPDKLSKLSKIQNPGGIKEADFWKSSCVDPANFLNLSFTNAYSKNGENAPGMYNVALWWSYKEMTEVFTGDPNELVPEDNFFDYHYQKSKQEKATKDVMLKKGLYGQLVKIPFGAQYKFWSNVPYGNMAYPYMRASEMALIEAEAYYMDNNEAYAKKALTELMSKRVSGYTCQTSGAALLEEIRVNRRMELFMEGHSFTDAKRWNISIERREWVEGDVTSGNTAPGNGLKKNPSDNKGWVFAIPYTESDYNTALDRTLLPK